MQITSNDDVNQLGIYAGVAGVGLVGGAAVVARATSPIYKKDKKAKDAAVADSVVAPATVTAGPDLDTRTGRNSKEGKQAIAKMNKIEKRKAKLADKQAKADAMFAQKQVKEIWGNDRADEVLQARNRNDQINAHMNEMRQARSEVAGTALDAPADRVLLGTPNNDVIQAGYGGNTNSRKTLPEDSPNFRRKPGSEPARRTLSPTEVSERRRRQAIKIAGKLGR